MSAAIVPAALAFAPDAAAGVHARAADRAGQPDGTTSYTLAYSYRAGAERTVFTRLRVHILTPGFTVRAICRGPRCPARAVTSTRPRFRLRTMERRRFTPGTVIKLFGSKPGRRTKVIRLRVRSRSRAPLSRVSCRAPGSRRRVPCS